MFFVPLLVTVLLAAEPEIVVKDITLKKAEFDSLADVLHIIQKSGTVEISGAETVAVRIEIDMYKKGQKLPDPLKSSGSRDRINKTDRIRFALNIVDMDYLALGDGEKGHCRLNLKVGAGNGYTSTTLDFDKKECDFSRMTLANGFGPNASAGNRIPVCWLVDSRTASLLGSGTPESVVKANPNADMAIVYIRIEN